MALADDTALRVEVHGDLTLRILGVPVGVFAGLIGLAVAALALLAVVRETRPLAALAERLERFGQRPETAPRLPEKGGLNALVPMNRKAKLWDLFGELYRQLALEAEEDFHNLFGREFLRAYEEHIAALDRQQRRG